MYLKDNETAGSDDINRRSLLFRYLAVSRHNAQDVRHLSKSSEYPVACGGIGDPVRIPEIP